MKILHTSDWHLGRALYGKKRYAEFTALLTWLTETIRLHSVDVLLVAGDIFDTSMPSNRAQELYYRFLGQVALSGCQHVVVIAGNHDSPSLLDAPRAVLRALNVHVIGRASSTPGDEVLVLSSKHNSPELIVCAVPYLRDRDIRVVEAGESVEDKNRKLIEGIHAHYDAVATQAKQVQSELRTAVPIIAMGHLFTAGGQTTADDGVRELYIGSLAHVSATFFPPCFDYVALGHLHVPQMVNKSKTIRYSGSPLPMGFGEAKQRKSVVLVEWTAYTAAAPPNQPQAHIDVLPVPIFQQLESIKGDWSVISKRISELVEADSCAWLEIIYDSNEIMGDLRERLETAVADSRIEILRVKNTHLADRVLRQNCVTEHLEHLDVNEIFARCLDAHATPDAQRTDLLRAYQETLASLHEDDAQAE